MTGHGPGLHHLHRRKRIHEGHEEYPHPKAHKRYLDQLLLVFASFAPAINIPQLFKIYVEKSAAGVSFASWALYTVFTIPWFVYGVMHRERLIIFVYGINFFLFGAIAVGALIYG